MQPPASPRLVHLESLKAVNAHTQLGWVVLQDYSHEEPDGHYHSDYLLCWTRDIPPRTPESASPFDIRSVA